MSAIEINPSKLRDMFADALVMLAKDSVEFERNLHVEGILVITPDDNPSIVAHVNRRFGESNASYPSQEMDIAPGNMSSVGEPALNVLSTLEPAAPVEAKSNKVVIQPATFKSASKNLQFAFQNGSHVVAPSAERGISSLQRREPVVTPSTKRGISSPQRREPVVAPSGKRGISSPQRREPVVASSGKRGISSPQRKEPVVAPSGKRGISSPQRKEPVVAPSGERGISSPQRREPLVKTNSNDDLRPPMKEEMEVMEQTENDFTNDDGQEAGDSGQEAGDSGQEAGDSGQEAGDSGTENEMSTGLVMKSESSGLVKTELISALDGKLGKRKRVCAELVSSPRKRRASPVKGAKLSSEQDLGTLGSPRKGPVSVAH